MDVKTSNCRLAFHGQLSHPFKEAASELAKGGGLGVFKYKVKEGVVERASNECEVICKGMFKKETNLALFGGLAVRLSTGEEGAIGEPFGQSGKFKVRVPGESGRGFRFRVVGAIFELEYSGYHHNYPA